MDIDTVITKATAMLQQAQNYKSIEAQKTAITGVLSGDLLVNKESFLVEGDGFTNLLNAKIVNLGGNLTTLNGSMDTLCDEIIVELAS